MASSGHGYLNADQKLAWLRLIRTDNVGPQTFRQLINREGSAEAALAALPSLARQAGRSLRTPSVGEAEDEIAAHERLGARLVASCEPDYPVFLREIANAPPLIAIAGNRRLNWETMVAMVGARNASAAGQKLARILAEEVGKYGIVVVSGLARGIDAAAHRASLSAGTVAVLAGGLDRIYPDENVPLAREIVERGGALVTEMPMGWEPRARDFPRRNRIVSGLSLGVVVVEAAKRSGSLITARLALEQDREVMAVPGSPMDPRAEGGNLLIQQGARLILNGHDIANAVLRTPSSDRRLFEAEWLPDRNHPDDGVPSETERERLVEALSPTPTEIDELIRSTGLSSSRMQTLLLELDLEGRIEWSAGQLVALRP